MDHNQIAGICRGVLLDNIFNTIPQDPWDRLIFEFANQYDGSDLTDMAVAIKFTKEVLEPTMADILRSILNS